MASTAIEKIYWSGGLVAELRIKLMERSRRSDLLQTSVEVDIQLEAKNNYTNMPTSLSNVVINYYLDGKKYSFTKDNLSLTSDNDNLHNHGAYEYIRHNIDGNKDLSFSIEIESFTNPGGITVVSNENSAIYTLTPLKSHGAIISTAPNFTDEDNPVITYRFPYDITYVKKVQAIISTDGVTEDIVKDIPSIGITSFTINLTEEERDLLRASTPNSLTKAVTFRLKTYGNSETGGTANNDLQKTLTIVNTKPTINPTLLDVNSDTIALTGNPRVFIQYESMVEFRTGAEGDKFSTIATQSVQCGSKTVYDSFYGVFDDIESGTFTFNATDSRGKQADTVVVTNTAMIEYVKPTCYQEVTVELSGETSAEANLTISGNYYHGSFGAVDNTLKIEVRYCEANKEMGEWITLTNDFTPSYDDKTYTLFATLTGFEHSKVYTFQCRATDKLNFVETPQYTLRILPVFDWSEEDFNFNVPVNVATGELNMNDKTVLRHNKEANNTVLSASGGHIYIRPKGTNNTTGEIIIYPNGDIQFSGKVIFAEGDNPADITELLGDYVVEAGTEEMGTNGTWYWQKWASGKAECWGCRNFGRMAVTTVWGEAYRSAPNTQNLPSNLFITTPDVININPVNLAYRGWISRHDETAPSAATTGSFVVMSFGSTTLTQSYIGFHVIGLWKQ